MKKLDFTDGSFLVFLETTDTLSYSEGTKQYIIHNPYLGFLFSTQTNTNYDIVKTDLKGNTWNFKRTGNVLELVYNGETIFSYSVPTSTTAFVVGSINNGALDISRHGGENVPMYSAHTQFAKNYITAYFLNSENIGLHTLTSATNYIYSQPNPVGTVFNLLNYSANNPFGTLNVYYRAEDENDKIPIFVSNNGAALTTWTPNNFSELLTDYDPIAPSIDPYAAAGTSTTGGGDGTFDGTSDPVDIPSLPTVGATDAGFITLFAPTEAQLKSLAEYMWSSAFDIEGGGTALAFKKLFNDPMDCILGLSVVPVTVPTSGAREITVGNIVTTVQMNVASQQYIEVDCGSISFANKYFGSYLDYEPYTKMAIFVPYSGVHTISADDVMGKTVTLKYHIDILTGSLVAFLKCGNSVLYEFNGACASNIPVNSLNYASTIENAIRIAVNIGTTVATAGAAAPATGALTGKAIAQGVALAGSTAEGAISMKPSIDRAGSLGGTTGLMGNQIPYIIITRPRLCRPADQNRFKGYPSFIEIKLSELDNSGYTEFDAVVLNNLYLTDSEKEELLNILYGGVYL